MNLQPTVLFQPLNHVGLGHINRLLVVALALCELDSDIRTLFAVEGASHVFLDAFRMPYIPLPDSHLMNEGDTWSAWSHRERAELQLEMAQSLVKSVVPQVVVFDCLPNRALADVVIAYRIPIVLFLREMRDLPSYLAEVSGLLDHVERIIVPHDPGTFLLPENLAIKSSFVGQIARPTPDQQSAHGGKRLNVLIAGGGGGYPGTVSFYNLALQSIVELSRNFSGVRGHLVTGPLFRDWQHLRLAEGITVAPFEPNMLARFSESDLVICQAGYNTVAELECVGTRTVLVPANRQWDDQFARAEHVSAGRKNFRMFRGTTPKELSDTAAELLGADIPNYRVATPAVGGKKAAELICQTVKGELRTGASQ